MFEQTFKNIDDILYKDAGCSSALDYIEQSSWMLFLKYLDNLEQIKQDEATLAGKTYKPIIDKQHSWSSWASPKDDNGVYDHNQAITGDDLLAYINDELFPYLKEFKEKTENSASIEYKIGEIFTELKNKIYSGYSLRDCLEEIDKLSFSSSKQQHELSFLYESRIKNMGNAGRNGGQYYTPRPLIRAMIKVVKPKIGESIYDAAVGSAGFLCEAFDYLRNLPNLTTKDLTTLQQHTFYGKEKKSLAYIIGVMNMILHGISAPNIQHINTLAENLADIQNKDRHDIVLANPPFGAKERKEIQQNFTIKSKETAYLFLQHFIKYLKQGGRAAVVIKNTFLSNSDNAAIALRKELLETCNLHTVLDCPKNIFFGTGIKTVVLFFTKGKKTSKTWYYQLDLGRSLGKNNALNDADLEDFIKLQASFADSAKSWTVDTTKLNANFDLSVNNPNAEKQQPLREPATIIDTITNLDNQSVALVAKIRGLL